LNGHVTPRRKEINTVKFNHRTETAAAFFRSPIGRRVGMLGVATAAIAGIAVGPAAASHSAAPVDKAASVASTTGTFANTVRAPHAPATTPASHTLATHAPAAKATAKRAPASHAPAAKATAKRAPAPHKPAVKVPSTKMLLPKTVHGAQASFKPTAAQKRNAAAIVKAGMDLKLPPRAMVMAVACSLQESSLHNYGNLGNRNDHDSLGLFQQRPSSGWGSPAQVTNAHHAAQSFMNRLVKIHNWQHMPLTRAVQKVQVSAFPQAYAKWEKFAASLVAGAYATDASHAAAGAAHAAGAVHAPGK
jgi:hypothetical protein